ncbi:MAG: APC family permease [Acidimicrobiales bacterium]|jgi:amino acid transporter
MATTSAVDGGAQATSGQSRLHGKLTIWAAIGLSVGLMAPSMAANINPQGAVPFVGRAIPLSFLVAAVGILLVSYSIARLCQHFHHAGSVYGFVGATLGVRPGVVAGWGLIGTYMFYAVTTTVAAGIFGTSLLETLKIWTNAPTWAPFILAGAFLVLIGVLASSPVRRATGALLAFEGATVALILLVSVIVLVKLVGGHAPGGHTFTWSVFSLPKGTGTSKLFQGAVFGFLSFAGFEASATLGEETAQPRRDIPRAIIGTVIFGGIYFVFVTAIEGMGFGISNADVAKYAGTGSLLGSLGSTYVTAWVGDLVTFGTVVSAFSCALACVVGSSRMLFSLARDASPGTLLARVSRWRTPVPAIIGILTGAVIVYVIYAGAFGQTAIDIFDTSGTIGTLILLVVYLLATIGAIRLLFFSGVAKVRRWEIVIPVAGALVLGYTLYRNVWPYPTGTYAWLPIWAGGWLLVAVIAVIVAPKAARRLGAMLTEADGLKPAGTDGTGSGGLPEHVEPAATGF